MSNLINSRTNPLPALSDDFKPHYHVMVILAYDSDRSGEQTYLMPPCGSGGFASRPHYLIPWKRMQMIPWASVGFGNAVFILTVADYLAMRAAMLSQCPDWWATELACGVRAEFIQPSASVSAPASGQRGPASPVPPR